MSEMSHTSIWMEMQEMPVFSSLKKNAQADVGIIGAGIAGLTCAYHLAEAGKKVIVVDRGLVGAGETGKTTAHLVNALDDRYYDLENYVGEQGAHEAAESHTYAINEIERIIKKEKIDCEFERVDGYLFTPPEHSENRLAEELKAAHRAGLSKVGWIDRAPVSFETGACLKFPKQGQFHALKYINGLVQALIKKGVIIHTDTPIRTVEEKGRNVTLTTAAQKKIRCTWAIIATNSPFNDRIAMHTKQAAYRTYVLGARIPKNSVPHILLWDTLNPYHYVRVKPMNAHDLLIIGGEDHKTGQMPNQNPYETLKKWSLERFPMINKIEYEWSGQIMEPTDSLAFIGLNPGDKRTYIVTGDSGNGLTHATVAGKLLTDLILKRKNPWEKLYNPSRKNIRAAKTFLKENLNVAGQYCKRMAPSPALSENKIPKGTGAVVKKEGEKWAVYRDKNGGLHCLSAVCTHLGCLVEWNGIEQSWDCPCHGSRFDTEGKILNGPAPSPLAKKTL